MSAVRVVISRNAKPLFFNDHVDGKLVCTTPAHTGPIALKVLLEKIFDAIDVENVEVETE